MEHISIYLKAFITLLVLVNPLEGMAVYLKATENAEIALKRKILRRAAFAIVIILIGSLFLGSAMLKVFSIDPGAFQVGGGAILFLIAIKMTLGSGVDSFPGLEGGKLTSEFAIVPLAIPLMAGPGAINGAVLYSTTMHTMWQMIIFPAVIILVGIVTYIVLRAGGKLAHYIGDSGISIITRIMGLIIAAISIEMIAEGIAQLYRLKLS